MVQQLVLSAEEKAKTRKTACLDEKNLVKTVEKCKPGTPEAADCSNIMLHKLAETKPIDYMPSRGKKVCGLTGVGEGTLTSEEHVKYMDIYCKIEPSHNECQKEEEEPEEEEEEKPQQQAEKAYGVASVEKASTTSSTDATGALIGLSSMSMCSLCMAAMFAFFMK